MGDCRIHLCSGEGGPISAMTIFVPYLQRVLAERPLKRLLLAGSAFAFLLLTVLTGLLAAMPIYAEGGLTLTCTTRDLAPGAHVWIEVEAQYQQQAVRPSTGFRDSALRQDAAAKHVWQFEVPASGEASPESYTYQFPAGVDWTKPDHFGSIYLKTRFRIDNPHGPRRTGYGEVTEVTFGMPIPDGTPQLSRCLRLRDEGDRLTAETAADCRDSTFEKARLGGRRVHVRPSPR